MGKVCPSYIPKGYHDGGEASHREGDGECEGSMSGHRLATALWSRRMGRAKIRYRGKRAMGSRRR